MAGYAFGRLRFPGKNLMFSLVLIQMMIPSQIFIIPQYLMVSKLGWLNTTAGLVFPGMVTAFGTYLLKTGYQGLPKDLEEAASIDGANAIQTLIKVKLPMLMSSFTICLFLTITNSFKLFDQNLALTSGEPAHATEMLALNIYNTFYSRAGAQWKGIGQAKAVIFFILVVIISLSQLYATRSKEVQA
jgi:ABC-type glycerol-3-phosphate transport system permease component